MSWQDPTIVLYWLIENHANGYEKTYENLVKSLRYTGANWKGFFTDEFFPEEAVNAEIIEAHGVNVGQAIKSEAVAYRYTHDNTDLDSTRQRVDLIEKHHGSVSGVLRADEHLAGLHPSRGTELCTVVEMMYSYEYAYSVMGENKFADNVERLAFNALPGALTDDMWAHQFLQQNNQPWAKYMDPKVFPTAGVAWYAYSSAEGRTIANESFKDSNIFGLEPNYPCCTVNHGQGWPKFISHAYLTSPDGSTLYHVLLSPTTVTTTLSRTNIVTVTARTNYPFNSIIEYSTTSDKDFNLAVRIPSWVSGSILFIVDGGSSHSGSPDSAGYVVVKVSEGSHTVSVTLPMAIKTEERFNKAMAVTRGPLAYSLDVEYTQSVIKNYELNSSDLQLDPSFDSSWQVAIDASTLKYNSDANSSNLAGSSSASLFRRHSAPVSISATVCPISWKIITNAADAPPSSPANCIGSESEIELIPYGAAKLRMSELPMFVSSRGNSRDGDRIEAGDFKPSWSLGVCMFGGAARGGFGCKKMDLRSDFDHVLDTNYVPSAAELAQLQLIIRTPERRIQLLEGQIARLQAEREELQCFVSRHRALLSLSRRVPADIWGEIFARCLPQNPLNLYVCSTKEPPLLFTMVCRTWRQITLNTPRLWNSLHIFLPSKSPGLTSEALRLQNQAKMSGLKLWFDRSGSLPLTISVSASYSPSSTEGEGASRRMFLGFLFTYSRRWKTLAIGAGTWIWNSKVFGRLTAEDLPLLENIYTSMNLFSSPISAYPVWNITASMGPPLPTSLAKLLPKIASLRSLHLTRECGLALDLPFDWSRLTVLTLFSLTDPLLPPALILQKLAKTCLSLTTLSFHTDLLPGGFVVSTVTSPNSEDPVLWPNLTELNIILEEVVNNFSGETPFYPMIKDTFDAIHAPELLRLSIQLGPSSRSALGFAASAPFHGLVSRSPRITHMQIYGSRLLQPEVLSGCIQLAPRLQALVLRREPFVGKGGAKAIHHSPSIGWLPRMLSDLDKSNPELKFLDCGQCGMEDINAVREFAAKRPRLKSLQAHFGTLEDRDIQMMTSEGTKELREVKGLSVELSWEKAPSHVDLDRSKYDNPSIGMPTADRWW
ncbi:hypothetical protein V5O48_004134 [Marasmius crinis-equi]|uniref:F-box domain-containing protein n=1 Tax=Marasmius crinis-equi TaxID=585013 RepID=A0ABR3FQZ8_9AGAR